MAMKDSSCSAGQWIEIGWTAFSPDTRAKDIPEETRLVPMLARVKGFALAEAEVGQIVKLKTVTGRILEGELLSVKPAYTHSFGEPQPELLAIGLQLRKEI